MVTTGQNAGTTYYLNDASSGAMEEKSIAAGVTTWRDHILVEGRMVAERFCTGAAPCASSGATLNYFVLDHLGSITVITDGSGNVLQRLSRSRTFELADSRRELGLGDLQLSRVLSIG